MNGLKSIKQTRELHKQTKLYESFEYFPIVVVQCNENMNKTESRVFNRDFPCGGRRYEFNNIVTSAHNDTAHTFI